MRLFLIFFIILVLTGCSSIDANKELTIGIRQYRNDSLKEAITTLTKAISDSSKCFKCVLYRGFAFKDSKQYDKALLDFDALIKIDSTQADGYANRASIFYINYDYQSALRYFEKAYSLDTTVKIFYNPICHMLFATGQKDSSCLFYQKSLKIGDTTFDNAIKVYCEKKTTANIGFKQWGWTNISFHQQYKSQLQLQGDPTRLVSRKCHLAFVHLFSGLNQA
jgi:tetratricopeptide (TPR) repeat protein